MDSILFYDQIIWYFLWHNKFCVSIKLFWNKTRPGRPRWSHSFHQLTAPNCNFFVTCDSWHLILDIWHETHDTELVVNIFSYIIKIVVTFEPIMQFWYSSKFWILRITLFVWKKTKMLNVKKNLPLGWKFYTDNVDAFISNFMSEWRRRRNTMRKRRKRSSR